MKVCVVTGTRPLRDGVADALARLPDVEQVVTAASGAEAVVAARDGVDVVVVDMALAHGGEAVEAVLEARPRTTVVPLLAPAGFADHDADHDGAPPPTSSRGLATGSGAVGPTGAGPVTVLTAAGATAPVIGGLPRQAVDLSAVVSEYVEETAKNVGRLLDAAEGGQAVLLSEEADALFGKRSGSSVPRRRLGEPDDVAVVPVLLWLPQAVGDRGPDFDGVRVGRPATGALLDAGYDSLADLPDDLDELLVLHGVGPRAVRILQEHRFRSGGGPL